jgi:Protein of unknown function (DUF1493)
MNSDADISLPEAVVEFVANEIGLQRNKIDANSRLREDPHVDGDDAYDLLIAFSRKFSVRDGDFVLTDHFGPEAAWFPFASVLRRGKLLPMTVQNLIDSAATGVWHVSSKAQLTANCQLLIANGS